MVIIWSVDDDRSQSLNMQKMIQQGGHAFHWTVDVEEVFSMYQMEVFSLDVTDIVMPDSEDIELIVNLRGCEFLVRIWWPGDHGLNREK